MLHPEWLFPQWCRLHSAKILNGVSRSLAHIPQGTKSHSIHRKTSSPHLCRKYTSMHECAIKCTRCVEYDLPSEIPLRNPPKLFSSNSQTLPKQVEIWETRSSPFSKSHKHDIKLQSRQRRCVIQTPKMSRSMILLLCFEYLLKFQKGVE